MKRSMRKLLGLLLAISALCGCKKDAPPPTPPEPPPATAPQLSAEEKCVDGWLSAKQLDPYGNPAGTLYAGGSPLFDEATGEKKDRLKYVYHLQPDAKAACSPTGKTP